MRVVAAMSGGVDSAVAAAHLIEAGHDVVGVHLALAADAATLRRSARGCCSIEDAGDARRVADRLGIPFYVWDLAERFRREVVEDFVAEYAAGRTPNPCLRCNEKIKFAALLDRALALGFDAVGTGHYARLLTAPDGSRELHRAVDRAKDQSYVLGVLSQDQLARSFFPLGDLTKDEVRAQAASRGFAVARKPDSHDICFIPDGDTRTWLGARIPRRPGNIVTADGAVVGRHDGAVGFTVGQRKGLGLRVPAPDGAPRYVLRVDPQDNTVVVGPRADLEVGRIVGERAIWCAPPPDPREPVGVQVRAHGAEVLAYVHGADDDSTGEPGTVDIRLAGAGAEGGGLRGVAAGQGAVFYRGTQVIGSCTIRAGYPA